MTFRRLTSVTLALVALTACYDFAGDDANLGFSTDARVGNEAWSPDVPLALGAQPTMAVTEVLGTEEEPSTVRWTVEGADARPDEEMITLQSLRGDRARGDRARGDRARGESPTAYVRASAGGVDDGFAVEWRPAAALEVEDRLAAMLDPDHDANLAPMLLLDGASVQLVVSLYDADDKPLGVVPRQLTVEGAGSVKAMLQDDTIRVLGMRPGLGTVTVGWPGLEPVTLEVETLAPEAIDTLEVREHHLDEACVLEAVLISDGDVVIGGDGFHWSHHQGDSERFAECMAEWEKGASVEWEDLRAEL